MEGLRIVSVRAEHIAKGKRLSRSRSPIALAIADRLIAGAFVQQHCCQIFICHRGERFWPHLPLNALRFSSRFIAREKVEPFSFGMELPAQFLKRARRLKIRKPANVASISHGRNGRIAARAHDKRKAA